MGNTLCTAEWCDQGDRPHLRHEVTAKTVIGEGWTQYRRKGVAVQLVVHGLEPDGSDAQPMVALVGPHGEQIDAVLPWPELHDLATAMITAYRRFTRPAAE